MSDKINKNRYKYSPSNTKYPLYDVNSISQYQIDIELPLIRYLSILCVTREVYNFNFINRSYC